MLKGKPLVATGGHHRIGYRRIVSCFYYVAWKTSKFLADVIFLFSFWPSMTSPGKIVTPSSEFLFISVVRFLSLDDAARQHYPLLLRQLLCLLFWSSMTSPVMFPGPLPPTTRAW